MPVWIVFDGLPERKGCPGEAVLKQLAERPLDLVCPTPSFSGLLAGNGFVRSVEQHVTVHSR
jgi:hypothetical protein